MTSYQGGKKKIGKQIYEQLLKVEKYFSDKSLTYIEPFCGMCGVMVHFAKENGRKIEAYDSNKDLIEMWKSLQKDNWIPKNECSEEYYNELKNSPEPSRERGFYGVVCSFGAQIFKGKFRTHSTQHNFITSGISGVCEAILHMKSVQFECSDYANLKHMSNGNYLIYCDPPYKNNKVSSLLFQNFDHEKFWNIMREWSKNNIVIISEKIAPDDFVSIWAKEYNVSYRHKENGNIKKSYQEQLFIHKDLFEKILIKKAPIVKHDD